jgi:hypothetical protein
VKLLQLLLRTSLAAYFPIVTLVKTTGGKTWLQKTSCPMMSLHISNSLHLSVRPSQLGSVISVIPNFIFTQ